MIHGQLPAELKERSATQPVDRLLLLQSSPLLAHATAAQLWRLSAIAKPVTLEANSEPLKRGGEASILIVLSGTLQIEGPDGIASWPMPAT